ncbi:hypothetical protein M569_06178, partial [Genlisea aurea]
IPRPSSAAWECMLPGPPSRNNGGSADISNAGLLAYASGSSVAVVDTHSMQLVSTLPLPPTSASTASPFVTAVRWSPLSLPHHLLETDDLSPYLVIAVGDRHGRISLLDFRSKAPIMVFDTNGSSTLKLGIQDLCWVQARAESWSLAAISGPSLLAIYKCADGECFFKYDASPEYFSCLRRDPFDSRHFCTLGLKGTGAPASAVFPNYVVKFAFSPHWKHMLVVGFPRELVLFDMQYESVLFASGFPRGCGKSLDVLPDLSMEVFYCAHLDGKLSTWRRKEGEQAYSMHSLDELLPAIGTSVPSPAVLAVAICQSNYTLQVIHKHCLETDSMNPLTSCDEPIDISKAHLITISDDGKIWKWFLTAQRSGADRKEFVSADKVVETNEDSVSNINSWAEDQSAAEDEHSKVQQREDSKSRVKNQNGSSILMDGVLLKINLVGQLQLLSSAVTMLAVPSPSLTATSARGGNSPAVAVPLVALATQGGTIDVIDIAANAVTASFSVHNTMVRGLRWLGNSRLVSLSYRQVTEKTGGYVNTLVVTCLRSGLNKTFRVLQKPERAPIRALRTSSSGRYLLILFRDSPVEVWAMTKTPLMLRSLALPFTVLEWTLPIVPRPTPSKPSSSSSFLSKDGVGISPIESSSPINPTTDAKEGTEGNQDEFSESFAFALVNGALGVFEVHGRRIRDFRPKWPSSSFVSSDGLITAMAYRLPHVVLGDRTGNIRWWDVTTGQSSSFSTHREGIRRIKFSPVVPGDRSRGRIAVLFYDNTFSVFDLDSPDPLANSVLQPQLPGTLVQELDWLPLRRDKDDPLVLCIAGADSSFRIIELPGYLGVKPSWFDAFDTTLNEASSRVISAPSVGDLRAFMIESPCVGDSAVVEMLLKVLEPYRKDGCLLDDERIRLYSRVVNKSPTLRFAYAAAILGENMEALFWLQFPNALCHLMNRFLNKSSQGPPNSSRTQIDEALILNRISSKGKSVPGSKEKKVDGLLKLMAFDQDELWESANERLPWHEKLENEEAIQNRVHELVSIGNLEGAVSLLLSTSPESSYFYANALRAVALSSAVSSSLHELAVKVVAANMVGNERSMSGTHLLCAVGRYQEACSQLQDAGCWTDAATLAATHLKGSDYARVLQRWGDHVLHAEHNIWRALTLYVAAGALQEALAALRHARLPDTAAMFVVGCGEIYSGFMAGLDSEQDVACLREKASTLPGVSPWNEDAVAVSEYFGQYQRKLVHLCMDSQPYTD